jgi:hypothetical protein
VARKLCHLGTRYAQCTVQHLINNLLYEAELGKYDEPPRKTHAREELSDLVFHKPLPAFPHSLHTQIRQVIFLYSYFHKYCVL